MDQPWRSRGQSGLPEVNGWAIVAPLIALASEQAVVEMDGNVYVIGGYPPGRIPVSEVQVYDSRTNRWRMVPPLPVPMHHSMAAAVYDPAADRWEVLPQVPTQRNHLAVVGIGSKVYVAGGDRRRHRDGNPSGLSANAPPARGGFGFQVSGFGGSVGPYPKTQHPIPLLAPGRRRHPADDLGSCRRRAPGPAGARTRSRASGGCRGARLPPPRRQPPASRPSPRGCTCRTDTP